MYGILICIKEMQQHTIHLELLINMNWNLKLWWTLAFQSDWLTSHGNVKGLIANEWIWPNGIVLLGRVSGFGTNKATKSILIKIILNIGP